MSPRAALGGLGAAALLLLLGACRSQEPLPAAKEASMMEWKGQFSGAARGGSRVLRTEAEWRAAWAEIGQPAPAAPDFKTHFAVAVFLGERRTGGYRVEWLPPAEAAGATVVRYKEVKPQGMAMQALTQPYAVKVFPLGRPEVRVEAAAD